MSFVVKNIWIYNILKNFFAGASEHPYKKIQDIYVYVAERGQDVSTSIGSDSNGTGVGLHWVDLLQICK